MHDKNRRILLYEEIISNELNRINIFISILFNTIQPNISFNL